MNCGDSGERFGGKGGERIKMGDAALLNSALLLLNPLNSTVLNFCSPSISEKNTLRTIVPSSAAAAAPVVLPPPK